MMSQEEVRVVVGRAVGDVWGEREGGGVKSFCEKASSVSSSSVWRFVGLVCVVGVCG